MYYNYTQLLTLVQTSGAIIMIFYKISSSSYKELNQLYNYRKLAVILISS